MPVLLGLWAGIRELLACHLLKLISGRIWETEPELKYLNALGEWAVLMYQHLDHHLRQFGVSCRQAGS